ncbi:hypothetical protein ABZ208_05845 [Streptomyces sp. NPDC006208]|uniref:hypothetical protein n=1 Tax=Streptomyces sp. NPDC006208 TaxID=3156734 RepID=UPI0033B2C5B9
MRSPGGGVAIQVITETLRTDRRTDRKNAHAATVDELLSPPRQSRQMLQPSAEYLDSR